MMSILDIKGLIRIYPPLQRVINGVDLSVEAGEIVNIIGCKASGKTTLLRLICGTERPDDGMVMIMDKDISCMDSKDAAGHRGKYLGVLSPDLELQKNMTAVHNATLPLTLQGIGREEREKRVISVLEMMNQKDIAHAKPMALSMYHKRCVKLIMGCIHEPKLIIMDDFFCGLSGEEESLLQEYFKSLIPVECAVIILSEHQCTLANRFYRLRNGKLEEV